MAAVSLQSLDGDSLSVIENPVAVSQQSHSETQTAAVAETKSVPAWLKGIYSINQGKLHSNTWFEFLLRIKQQNCCVV